MANCQQQHHVREHLQAGFVVRSFPEIVIETVPSHDICKTGDQLRAHLVHIVFAHIAFGLQTDASGIHRAAWNPDVGTSTALI